jgi:hypothetical protein
MKTQIAKFLVAAAAVSYLGLAVGSAEAQTYGGGAPSSRLSSTIKKYYETHQSYDTPVYGHVR